MIAPSPIVISPGGVMMPTSSPGGLIHSKFLASEKNSKTSGNGRRNRVVVTCRRSPGLGSIGCPALSAKLLMARTPTSFRTKDLADLLRPVREDFLDAAPHKRGGDLSHRPHRQPVEHLVVHA